MMDGADAGRRALASSAPLRYATVLGAHSPSVARSNEFCVLRVPICYASGWAAGMAKVLGQSADRVR